MKNKSLAFLSLICSLAFVELTLASTNSAFNSPLFFRSEEKAYLKNSVRIKFNTESNLRLRHSVLARPKLETVDFENRIALQVPMNLPNEHMLIKPEPRFLIKALLNDLTSHGQPELTLDSYILDPVSHRSFIHNDVLQKNFKWSAAPAQTDLSVAVDRLIVNDLIKLSVLRALPGFHKIEDEGHTFKYTRPPEVLPLNSYDLQRVKNEAIVKVRVGLLVPDSMFGLKEKTAFSGPFELVFEALAEIRQSSTDSAAIELAIVEAYENTISFDRSKLTLLGRMSAPVVKHFMKNMIDDIVRRWRDERKPLGIEVTLPLKAIGSNLEIMKIDTRTSDYIQLHLKEN